VSSTVLEDVCEFITDGTHYTPPNAGEGYPFLTVADMRAEGLNFSSCSRITADHFAEARRQNSVPRTGDVLFSKDGTVGKVHVVNGEAPFAVLSSIAIIRPDPTLLVPEYLAHFLKTPQAISAADQSKTGSALRRIILKDIKRLKLLPLELPEQRRIAAILDQADELRRTQRATLATLSKLQISLFYELFGDPILNSRGLPLRRLGEVGTLDRGVSRHRPRNDPALLGGDHPLIQTGDVSRADDYLLKYSSTYSDLGLRQSKMWPTGTLCITIAANIADTAILGFDCCFPDSVVGFDSGNPALNFFVHAWFKLTKGELERVAPNVAQKNINLAILRDLTILDPPPETIEKFFQLSCQLETTQTNARQKVAGFKKLFASLQHRAFRGEL
jgi:type I restriction enzyme S subunit